MKSIAHIILSLCLLVCYICNTQKNIIENFDPKPYTPISSVCLFNTSQTCDPTKTGSDTSSPATLSDCEIMGPNNETPRPSTQQTPPVNFCIQNGMAIPGQNWFGNQTITTYTPTMRATPCELNNYKKWPPTKRATTGTLVNIPDPTKMGQRSTGGVSESTGSGLLTNETVFNLCKYEPFDSQPESQYCGCTAPLLYKDVMKIPDPNRAVLAGDTSDSPKLLYQRYVADLWKQGMMPNSGVPLEIAVRTSTPYVKNANGQGGTGGVSDFFTRLGVIQMDPIPDGQKNSLTGPYLSPTNYSKNGDGVVELNEALFPNADGTSNMGSDEELAAWIPPTMEAIGAAFSLYTTGQRMDAIAEEGAGGMSEIRLVCPTTTAGQPKYFSMLTGSDWWNAKCVSGQDLCRRAINSDTLWPAGQAVPPATLLSSYNASGLKYNFDTRKCNLVCNPGYSPGANITIGGLSTPKCAPVTVAAKQTVSCTTNSYYNTDKDAKRTFLIKNKSAGLANNAATWSLVGSSGTAANTGANEQPGGAEKVRFYGSTIGDPCGKKNYCQLSADVNGNASIGNPSVCVSKINPGKTCTGTSPGAAGNSKIQVDWISGVQCLGGQEWDNLPLPGGNNSTRVPGADALATIATKPNTKKKEENYAIDFRRDQAEATYGRCGFILGNSGGSSTDNSANEKQCCSNAHIVTNWSGQANSGWGGCTSVDCLTDPQGKMLRYNADDSETTPDGSGNSGDTGCGMGEGVTKSDAKCWNADGKYGTELGPALKVSAFSGDAKTWGDAHMANLGPITNTQGKCIYQPYGAKCDPMADHDHACGTGLKCVGGVSKAGTWNEKSTNTGGRCLVDTATRYFNGSLGCLGEFWYCDTTSPGADGKPGWAGPQGRGDPVMKWDPVGCESCNGDTPGSKCGTLKKAVNGIAVGSSAGGYCRPKIKPGESCGRNIFDRQSQYTETGNSTASTNVCEEGTGTGATGNGGAVGTEYYCAITGAKAGTDTKNGAGLAKCIEKSKTFGSHRIPAGFTRADGVADKLPEGVQATVDIFTWAYQSTDAKITAYETHVLKNGGLDATAVTAENLQKQTCLPEGQIPLNGPGTPSGTQAGRINRFCSMTGQDCSDGSAIGPNGCPEVDLSRAQGKLGAYNCQYSMQCKGSIGHESDGGLCVGWNSTDGGTCVPRQTELAPCGLEVPNGGGIACTGTMDITGKPYTCSHTDMQNDGNWDGYGMCGKDSSGLRMNCALNGLSSSNTAVCLPRDQSSGTAGTIAAGGSWATAWVGSYMWGKAGTKEGDPCYFSYQCGAGDNGAPPAGSSNATDFDGICFNWKDNTGGKCVTKLGIGENCGAGKNGGPTCGGYVSAAESEASRDPAHCKTSDELVAWKKANDAKKVEDRETHTPDTCTSLTPASSPPGCSDSSGTSNCSFAPTSGDRAREAPGRMKNGTLTTSANRDAACKSGPWDEVSYDKDANCQDALGIPQPCYNHQVTSNQMTNICKPGLKCALTGTWQGEPGGVFPTTFKAECVGEARASTKGVLSSYDTAEGTKDVVIKDGKVDKQGDNGMHPDRAGCNGGIDEQLGIKNSATATQIGYPAACNNSCWWPSQCLHCVGTGVATTAGVTKTKGDLITRAEIMTQIATYKDGTPEQSASLVTVCETLGGENQGGCTKRGGLIRGVCVKGLPNGSTCDGMNGKPDQCASGFCRGPRVWGDPLFDAARDRPGDRPAPWKCVACDVNLDCGSGTNAEYCQDFDTNRAVCAPKLEAGRTCVMSSATGGSACKSGCCAFNLWSWTTQCRECSKARTAGFWMGCDDKISQAEPQTIDGEKQVCTEEGKWLKKDAPLGAVCSTTSTSSSECASRNCTYLKYKTMIAGTADQEGLGGTVSTTSSKICWTGAGKRIGDSVSTDLPADKQSYEKNQSDGGGGLCHSYFKKHYTEPDGTYVPGAMALANGNCCVGKYCGSPRDASRGILASSAASHYGSNRGSFCQNGGSAIYQCRADEKWNTWDIGNRPTMATELPTGTWVAHSNGDFGQPCDANDQCAAAPDGSKYCNKHGWGKGTFSSVTDWKCGVKSVTSCPGVKCDKGSDRTAGIFEGTKCYEGGATYTCTKKEDMKAKSGTKYFNGRTISSTSDGGGPKAELVWAADTKGVNGTACMRDANCNTSVCHKSYCSPLLENGSSCVGASAGSSSSATGSQCASGHCSVGKFKNSDNTGGTTSTVCWTPGVDSGGSGVANWVTTDPKNPAVGIRGHQTSMAVGVDFCPNGIQNKAQNASSGNGLGGYGGSTSADFVPLASRACGSNTLASVFGILSETQDTASSPRASKCAVATGSPFVPAGMETTYSCQKIDMTAAGHQPAATAWRLIAATDKPAPSDAVWVAVKNGAQGDYCLNDADCYGYCDNKLMGRNGSYKCVAYKEAGDSCVGGGGGATESGNCRADGAPIDTTTGVLGAEDGGLYCSNAYEEPYETPWSCSGSGANKPCLPSGSYITSESKSVNGTGNKACCHATSGWRMYCNNEKGDAKNEPAKKKFGGDCGVPFSNWKCLRKVITKSSWPVDIDLGHSHFNAVEHDCKKDSSGNVRYNTDEHPPTRACKYRNATTTEFNGAGFGAARDWIWPSANAKCIWDERYNTFADKSDPKGGGTVTGTVLKIPNKQDTSITAKYKCTKWTSWATKNMPDGQYWQAQENGSDGSLCEKDSECYGGKCEHDNANADNIGGYLNGKCKTQDGGWSAWSASSYRPNATASQVKDGWPNTLGPGVSSMACGPATRSYKVRCCDKPIAKGRGKACVGYDYGGVKGTPVRPTSGTYKSRYENSGQACEWIPVDSDATENKCDSFNNNQKCMPDGICKYNNGKSPKYKVKSSSNPEAVLLIGGPLVPKSQWDTDATIAKACVAGEMYNKGGVYGRVCGPMPTCTTWNTGAPNPAPAGGAIGKGSHWDYAWSKCSAGNYYWGAESNRTYQSCGKGTQTREFLSRGDGSNCKPTNKQTRTCNEGSCPMCKGWQSEGEKGSTTKCTWGREGGKYNYVRVADGLPHHKAWCKGAGEPFPNLHACVKATSKTQYGDGTSGYYNPTVKPCEGWMSGRMTSCCKGENQYYLRKSWYKEGATRVAGGGKDGYNCTDSGHFSNAHSCGTSGKYSYTGTKGQRCPCSGETSWTGCAGRKRSCLYGTGGTQTWSRFKTGKDNASCVAGQADWRNCASCKCYSKDTWVTASDEKYCCSEKGYWYGAAMYCK